MKWRQEGEVYMGTGRRITKAEILVQLVLEGERMVFMQRGKEPVNAEKQQGPSHR